MRSLSLLALIFGILSAPVFVFAQGRCQNIFETQEAVIHQLAQLKVDSEGAPLDIARVLNQAYQTKLQSALNAGLDLSTLKNQVEEIRLSRRKNQKERDSQRQAIEETEKKLIKHLVVKRSIETNYPWQAEFIRYTGNGKYIQAYIGKFRDHHSEFYDSQTGRQMKNIPTSFFTESKVDISKDGQSVIGVIATPETISLLAVDINSRATKKFEIPHEQIMMKGISKIEFKYTSDERLVAGAQTGSRHLTIWDMNTQKRLKKLKLEHELSGFSFSADGKHLFVITDPGQLQHIVSVLDTQTFQEVARHQFGDMVFTLTLTPNNQALVYHYSGDKGENIISLWDLQSAKVNEISEVVYQQSSGDGSHFVLYSRGSDQDANKIKLFRSLNADFPLSIFSYTAGDYIKSVDINTDGSQIIVSRDKNIDILEMEAAK